MTLLKYPCEIRHTGSGLLLLFSVLAHANAHAVRDQAALPAQAEAPESETVKTDPKSGDIVVEGQGIASWYGRTWRGRRTASGTLFDDRAMTAAHLRLPFATRARVTNMQNGRSVDVVVNDRGPYRANRIIDLSPRRPKHSVSGGMG